MEGVIGATQTLPNSESTATKQGKDPGVTVNSKMFSHQKSTIVKVLYKRMPSLGVLCPDHCVSEDTGETGVVRMLQDISPPT